MGFTIAEIAKQIGAQCAGDTDLRIEQAAEPADAGASDLAMAMSPKYAESLPKGSAQAAMLWEGADYQALGLKAAIFPPRPRLAMARMTAMLDRGQGFGTGIHETAVIDPTAEIGADVTIGPLAVIGPRARIGARSVIGPHCFIGMDATLGEDAFLREMVSIGARVTIGARFIAQPGVRLGGDGFSFVTPEVSGVERVRESLGDQGDITAQSYVRIHSLGSVRLGDDVEMGANATIDNGTIRDTTVGNGCKFDNMSHLGHNVRMGNDCLICGQVGVGGSTVIGNNVVLGGQTGVGDNLFLGDNVITGGATKVLANVPAGRVMLGYPATKMESQLEIYKAMRRLPRALRDIAALQKAVFKSGDSD